MKCPKCNFENLGSVKFCEECGASVDIECPNCGNVVLINRKFCGECGFDFKEPAQKIPAQSNDQFQTHAPQNLLSSAGLTPFVGRKDSMTILNEIFEKACSGSGQVVGIQGEPGVGKSRLLMEFVRSLPLDEIFYLEGRCPHFGNNMAYMPILGMLKYYFNIKEGENESEVKKKIQDKSLKLDKELKNSIPFFQNLMSIKPDDKDFEYLDPQTRRDNTFESIRGLFIKESQKRPLVLAVEDLQWIDRASENFINYLTDSLSEVNILLILLFRPEYTHNWTDKSCYSQVDLDRLNIQSRTELVDAVLDSRETDHELKRLILEHTGGNPLYTEEFTRTLLEKGFIQNTDNKYILKEMVNDTEIPGTIKKVITSRVDLLEENLKHILQAASIMGEDFELGILQNITVMQEELSTCIEKLHKLKFIYKKSRHPELKLIFSHALVQEAAYNSMLLSKRKELHERIGLAIEESYPERMEEYYDVLAYHYSESDNLEKAVEYGEKAAHRAMSIFAHENSVKLFEQSIEMQEGLDSENKRKICELQLGLGDALISAGNPRRVLDSEAPLTLSIAQEMGDNKLASQVCQLAIWALIYDSWGGAFSTPVFAKWSELADRYADPDTIERVWSDMGMGLVKFNTGNSDEGLTLIHGAYKLAQQIGDPETLWMAAGYFLWYGFAPKYQEEQLRLAEEMLGKSRSGVSIRTLVDCLSYAGAAFLIYGIWENALENFSDLRQLAERTDQPHHQLRNMGWEILNLHISGQLEKAVVKSTHLRKMGNEFELVNYTNTLLMFYIIRPLLYLYGPGKEIEPYAQFPEFPPSLLCAAHLGRDEEVKEVLEQYIANRKYADENYSFLPQSDTILLETAVKVKHLKAVELFLHRFENSNAKTSCPWCITYVHRHTGDAWELLGNPEKARADYNEALELANEWEFRPEIALIRFQLAKLLFHNYPDDKEEAQEHLDFAISEFREMKMRPFYKEASGEELLVEDESFEYKDEGLHFTVEYPSGWFKEKLVFPKQIFNASSISQLPNIQVYVDNIPEGISLNDFPKSIPEYYKQVLPETTGHKIISEKIITLEDGIQAVEFDMEWNWDNPPLILLTMFMVVYKDNKFIRVISTNNLTDSLDINRKIIHSLKFY